MIKRLILLFSLIIILSGCQIDNKELSNKESNINMDNVIITIDNKEYSTILEDNKTVKELLKHLPQEYSMNELNGNEKYVYLDYSLPTNQYNPQTINKGDIMLFGDNCLVIFYKSFSTTYAYTKIGHIEDLPNLNKDSINIKISIK